MTSLYDFTVSDQADQPVSLQDYRLNRQYSNRVWFDAAISGLAGTL